MAIEQFQDYLAPQLDVYEQAVYLYILRHSRLIGKPRLTIELKTARHLIAKGLGKRGSPLAERTCLDKLKSLAKKGCITLTGADDVAPDVRVLLPSEVPGLIKKQDRRAALDYFNVLENRRLILDREQGRCFYCFKKLNESNRTLDHVARGPTATSGYRNVVACCRRCNNRKGESSAEDLVRVLYREGYVTADVLADRLLALQSLREGELVPRTT